MPTAFPNRYIDKEDSQYERWFQHVFILKPPLQGATPRDFIQFADDLKSAMEAKNLSETDSIPRSSFGSRELSLQSLKSEIEGIISQNPIGRIRGCDCVSLMHHPDKRGKLVSLLSKLPESIHRGQKLISVPHSNEMFVFNIQLHENRFIPTDGLYIWLNNPSDPSAEHVVPSDGGESLNIREVFQSKQKMEYFAMMSLCNDLLTITNLTYNDLKCQYEPLGNAFPDFELVVRDKEWAVEVTRIEVGMVSYLPVSEPLEKDRFDKAARNRVTDRRIIAALTKALEDKTKKRNNCSRYTLACLLLVDVVDSVDPASSILWNGINLSAFDAVALVKLDGSIFFIKGAHTFEPAS